MTFVEIDTLPGGGGLRVTDRIERRRCDLHTESEVTARVVDGSPFVVPVDTAVVVETDGLVFPQLVDTYVRDADGTLVREIGHFEEQRFPEGVYTVEFSAPIKLYLRVEGPLRVTSDATTVSVDLEGDPTVFAGARSYHDRPAATITTTEDPEDLLRAVSYLGSALKTVSPERSYPTLRGHPPAIELGEAFHVPAGLERPENGVTIEVPPSVESAFVVAPLAYYLGADVVPGDSPRVVTDRGFVHPLDGPEGFETVVERTLKQVFFLDCLVRTEGYYPVDLYERRAVEDAGVLPFDLAETYDQSLTEQLATYLTAPFEALEPHMPTWKLTGHVEPTPDRVETLPFLVDDLAVIRTPRGEELTPAQAQSAAIETFMRDTRGSHPDQSCGTAGCPPRLVRPEPVDSLEQAWAGADAPVGASKVTVKAYRNRLDQEPTMADFGIAVVCNDPEMLTEQETARDVYGSRDELPFDVTFYRNLSTDRLRLVLESDVDFLHYIGHIDDEGLRCPDGHLDARTLDRVGVDVFFLNACRSYEQGMALVEGGAIGGVSTFDEVINAGATTVGMTMARLLNGGFPVQAALNIASKESVVGGQYLVVGDGNVEVAQAETITPFILYVEPDGERYTVRFRAYPTRLCGLGTTATPALRGVGRNFLAGNVSREFAVEKEDLSALLRLGPTPVYVDGDLHWSEELSLDDL
ncbi:hypothetical protein [Halomarina litorea]|uniref:hypothetical protein n=1 Tax=Halomarina litorea TaxID=2961595 RepID=UPI0020C3BE5A|nr:hypothetical protein [Halomarina sp. BCD28]